MNLSWMAWTWQTAVFFVAIAIVLAAMGLWERLSPGGGARKGVLGFRTTRGDRLFISLLLAAYVHLAWLGYSAHHLWGAGLLSLVLAVFVFRKV